MVRKRVYLTVMALLLGIGHVEAAIFISPNQTDDKESVHIGNTPFWTFTPEQDTSGLHGGRFRMKKGPHTDKDITLDIIQGEFADPYGPGYNEEIEPLLRVTLSPEKFQINPTWVFFEDTQQPIALSAGTTYTAILYSPAETEGDRRYLLKGGNTGSADPVLYVDAGGNPVGATVPSQSHVPEPSTLVVWSLLGGVAAVVGWRRRRRLSL